eukprot:758185-Hanusia_phi.AAC.7
MSNRAPLRGLTWITPVRSAAAPGVKEATKIVPWASCAEVGPRRGPARVTGRRDETATPSPSLNPNRTVWYGQPGLRLAAAVLFGAGTRNKALLSVSPRF